MSHLKCTLKCFWIQIILHLDWIQSFITLRIFPRSILSCNCKLANTWKKKKNMIHPKVLFRVFIPFLPPNRSILSSNHIICMIFLKLYANNFFSMRWCACQLKCRINQSFLCLKWLIYALAPGIRQSLLACTTQFIHFLTFLI